MYSLCSSKEAPRTLAQARRPWSGSFCGGMSASTKQHPGFGATRIASVVRQNTAPSQDT